ncbi:hypothetical protein E4633_14645 [Geomonas terrae]|uniref:Carboxypeptidase regulatory-like domain-containing protein n=1 Tax=Geomonas terrae TaxID=2562681 RepID=A0A4S1CDP4_9BACT|nr:hypothetical protein [Geomonas terrae]TGU71547.1 hypothetical protein E4633_14645 [Geomonas terrae]
MRTLLKRTWGWFVLVTVVAIVAGCGGGGGNETVERISGTAAAGVPIIGTVTLKDSTAVTKTVSIAANGKYSVDVSGMKAPFMVRADGYASKQEYHLYSAATAEDVNKNTNVTPLTDLIVANVAGSMPQTYFESGNFSTITASGLTAETEALKAKLLPTLQAVGVANSIDLLRTSFSTDHSGLDAALDVIRVSTDPDTKVATITNAITQQTMTSDITSGTYTGSLSDTTGVASGVTAIQAISDKFKAFSEFFATGLPNATNPGMVNLFDQSTFLHSGRNLAAFLAERTTDQKMVGVSFTNISLQSMNEAQDNCVVAFEVVIDGKPIFDGPRPWHVTKKNGVWLMQGDQRIADVGVMAGASYDVSTASDTTGLSIYVDDSGERGITSAVVSGAGLTTPITLSNQTSGFLSTQELFPMSDEAIEEIPDSGAVYTIQLYQDATLVATYTEKIMKRPYLSTELKVADFPAISSPTLEQLKNFNGGNVTIAWTLPTGFTNGWLYVRISNDTDSFAEAQFSLRTSEHSKSFMLNPVTEGGQSFTITNRWISLTAYDGYGRTLETIMH